MEEQTFTQISDGGAYGYGWRSPRWRCDTCGRSGYYDPATAYRGHWSEACKRGHSPCEWCGTQLALRMDGTPRVHTRCKERPDDAELLRFLAREVRADARLAVRGPFTTTSRALLDRLTSDLRGGPS